MLWSRLFRRLLGLLPFTLDWFSIPFLASRRLRVFLAGFAVIADKLAFWYVDAAYANPDVEILNAVEPGLAWQTKSELFRDLLPLLNSGRIVLPRNDRLQGQIVGLERRTSAVGRDTISHPDRGHDDVANAVAGAAALSKFGGYDTSMRWVSGDDDSGDAWQRVRLQAFINSGGRIRL